VKQTLRERIKGIHKREIAFAPALHHALILLFAFVDRNGEPAKYQPIENGFALPLVDSVRVNLPSSDLQAWRKLLDCVCTGDAAE
jgi:hypothetical protein